MPEPFQCEVVPLPGDQVSFRIDGVEVTRWHFGDKYKRPFFFPVARPNGESLTRIGHPGASNHDHHRSVWFAHHKLLGIDFWSENTDAYIRQKMWFEYRDGEDECAMAVQLDWHDGHDPQPLVEQEMIVIVRPLGEDGNWTLDLQSTFRPHAEQIEFQQTNYGFLAVRLAKSISAHFGDGTITGSSGEVGEENLFGKENRWIDYSGLVTTPDIYNSRTSVTQGITYFDHPDNPHFPAKWHVREDGWMGASACRDESLVSSRLDPLRLRYLLHIHDGEVDKKQADQIVTDWEKLPTLTVSKSTRKHQQFEIVTTE